MRSNTLAKFKRFGPFEYFRTTKGTISAWWAGKDNNIHWGWEFGPLDDIVRHPHVWLRIGPLIVFGLEILDNGFEAWLMGFWWHRYKK